MAKKGYLKSENAPWVAIFITWCVSLYLVFLSGSGLFWTELQSLFAQLSAKDSLLVTLMPILVVILSGIISPGIKAVIVFWRVKNALPGHRAFTKHAPADSRIDMDAITNKLGTLPVEPKEQNTLWFSIYKQVEDSTTVRHAHKNFLLTRDLASIALIFSIAGSIGLSFGHVNYMAILKYVGLMILHFLLLAIVAQNYGNRFVCNVLTEFAAIK